MKLWIVRDSVGPQIVSVWTSRPRREPFLGGHVWVSQELDLSDHVESLFPSDAAYWYTTIPANDREVIVCEVNEPARINELRRQMDRMAG